MAVEKVWTQDHDAEFLHMELNMEAEKVWPELRVAMTFRSPTPLMDFQLSGHTF